MSATVTTRATACAVCNTPYVPRASTPGSYRGTCSSCASQIAFEIPVAAEPVTVPVKRAATFRRVASLRRMTRLHALHRDHVAMEHVPRDKWQLMGVYLGLIAVAELSVLVSPTAGVVLLSVTLAMLLLHAALTVVRTHQVSRVATILAILPIMRIASLTTPLGNFSYLQWFLLISGVVALATFALARELRCSAEEARLTLPHPRHVPLELGIAALGIPIGFAEYALLKPGPIVDAVDWMALVGPSILFILATGVLEETIFRGLLPRYLAPVYGVAGAIAIPAAAQALLDVGSLDLAHILLVGGVGVAYGLVAHRTRTVLGVGVSHGIANALLFIVLPALHA